jgi:nucleoid-associated protein YgaU
MAAVTLGSDAVTRFLILLAIGSLAYALAAIRPSTPSRRVRIKVRRPRLAAFSLLGSALGFSPTDRVPSPPFTDHRLPPRSVTSGFSPPRSLVRTGGPNLSSVTRHARLPGPLFPRATPKGLNAPPPLHTHPAVRGPHCRAQPAPTRVVVAPGDTLWSIAADALGTQNPRAIARFWPRIHRNNRALIGPDPSRIFPGQIFRLPD